MLRRYDTLEIAERDKAVALNLLSAVVRGWHFLPPAAQARIIHDACLMGGNGQVLSWPDQVLSFIDQNKDRPTLRSVR